MRSFWLASSNGKRFPVLPETGLEVDVAVVGGGIAGVTAALLLKQSGKRVAVLESRQIGCGETGHTTAHVTAIQDLPFRIIQSKFGREGARRIVAAGMQAIELIERHVRTFNIDCEFERLPGYVFTELEPKVEELRREIRAARNAGLDVSFVDEIPLPFEIQGALRIEDQARFHPNRYLARIAQQIPGDGSFVFEHTHVTQVVDGSPCVVKTEHGEVRAQQVIGATDAVNINRFFLQTKVAPYRSYAIALRVDREFDGLFYDTAEPYHYIRTHPDAEGPLLIVGGADHRVGVQRDTEQCYRELEQYVRQRFETGPVAFRWSGQIEEPLDGLPYIGRNSLSSNVYVATGFSGNGMVNGTIAAMVICDLVLGRGNPYAELLAATRLKPLASARQFVSENREYPIRLIKDRLPSVHRDPQKVPLGEGLLVAHHGRKLAVYRDEDGELYAMSAVCPHMGCHVQWNREAKSWDCPCHGSRFEATGEVIHGPSTRGLQRVELEEERHEEAEPSLLPVGPEETGAGA